MQAHSRLTSRQSKKFTERRKARAVITGVLFIVCATSWIFSFAEFGSLSFFSIQNVNVIGADKDIQSQVATAAMTALHGSYLGLFSKSNTVLYPKSTVVAAVASSSPRIQSVSVSRDGLQGLAITVNEKKPSAVICTSLPDFSTSDQMPDGCYFADASGLIFEPAPTFSDHVYNRYYIPGLSDSGTAESRIIGSYATSTAEFAALQEFYDGAHLSGIDPVGALVKDGGEYELYARNRTSSDVMVIYFNDSRSIHDELVNLVSFWKNEPGDLDYIDLRYGSNVFFHKNQ